MLDYQARVAREKIDLDEKIEKLQYFFGEKAFGGVPVAEQQRLRRQLGAMRDYSRILRDRIDHFPAVAQDTRAAQQCTTSDAAQRPVDNDRDMRLRYGQSIRSDGDELASLEREMRDVHSPAETEAAMTESLQLQIARLEIEFLRGREQMRNEFATSYTQLANQLGQMIHQLVNASTAQAYQSDKALSERLDALEAVLLERTDRHSRERDELDRRLRELGNHFQITILGEGAGYDRDAKPLADRVAAIEQRLHSMQRDTPTRG